MHNNHICMHVIAHVYMDMDIVLFRTAYIFSIYID